MVAKTNRRWIVGLTGRNASGKGETAHLLEKRGYHCRSLSDALRDEAKAKGITPSRENLIDLGRRLRESEGPDALAKRTVATLTEDRYVIDSIRNVEEIALLRQSGNFLLIGVDAPIDLRFARSQTRGREENAKTLEEFRAVENQERAGGRLAQQLDACMEQADVTLNNATTLADLETQLEEALRSKKFLT